MANKIERQALLEKLLHQESEFLRKRAFPYKRRPLLASNVTIEEGDLSARKSVGTYEYLKDANTHKITISSKIIDDWYTPIYWNEWNKYYKIGKKYDKERMRNTIRHELIHAFVKENYNDMCEIQEANSDASPIFLLALDFFFATSNHECVKAWKESQLCYDNRTGFIDFQAFDDYIIKLCFQYNKVVTKLNKSIEEEIIKSKKCTSNIFIFASRNPGFTAEKSITDKIYVLGTKDKIVAAANLFEVGCCIQPQEIERYVADRINGNKFKKSESMTAYLNESIRLPYVKLAEGSEIKYVKLPST
jgi:hypothetical protein